MEVKPQLHVRNTWATAGKSKLHFGFAKQSISFKISVVTLLVGLYDRVSNGVYQQVMAQRSPPALCSCLCPPVSYTPRYSHLALGQLSPPSQQTLMVSKWRRSSWLLWGKGSSYVRKQEEDKGRLLRQPVSNGFSRRTAATGDTKDRERRKVWGL